MEKSGAISISLKFGIALWIILFNGVNAAAQGQTKLADSIYPVFEKMQRVRVNQKYGFKKEDGTTLVIPAVYDAANDFSEGFATVKQNGKVGFVNAKGMLVIPLKFDGARNFNNGIAIASLDKEYIFIDKEGNQASVRKYQFISKVEKVNMNYYLAKKDNKWGLINPAGQEIIPPDYEFLRTTDLKIIAAKRGDKCGYIDTSNNVVIPFEYSSVGSFEGDNYAIAKKGIKYGLIDRKGKEVLPFNYLSIDEDGFTGYYIIENLNTKMGVFDNKGKMIVDFEYDEIGNFMIVETGEKKDDYMVGARVKQGGGWGIIGLTSNSKVRELVKPSYTYKEILVPVNGNVIIKGSEKMGVFSIKNQDILISFRYDGIGEMSEDKYIVRQGEKYGFAKWVDRKKFETSEHEKFGEIKYEKARLFKNGFAAVKLNSKWGFVDDKGAEIIFPRYDLVEDFENGKAKVTQGSDTFFIDAKGRAVR